MKAIKEIIPVRIIDVNFKKNLMTPKLNKNNNLCDNYEAMLEYGWDNVTFTVKKQIMLNDEDYKYLMKNFLTDFDFLKGMPCGTCVEDDRLFEGIKEYSEEWRNLFKLYGINLCVEIINNENNYKHIYVNTEGYSYCRYVMHDFNNK